MSRVAPASTPRQRIERERDKDYLAYLASLKCCLCGAEPECAHVRFGEACPECDGRGFWVAQPYTEECPAGPDPRQRYCTNCLGTGYRYGKRPVGAAEKPSDAWTLSLCPNHHRLTNLAQHANGERAWWKEQGVDPLELCVRLQDAYAIAKSRAQAVELGLAVIEEMRR